MPITIFLYNKKKRRYAVWRFHSLENFWNFKTRNNTMSSQDDTINQCEECKEVYTNYTNSYYRWCKQCQLNNLKRILASSENEELDNFIQDMQSKIDDPSYTIFEWIPYNQFNNIKEISKDRFFTVHSAI